MRVMEMNLTRNHVVILDKNAKNNQLYSPWTSLLISPCFYVEDYEMGWSPPPNCGLLVTAQHYSEPEFDILRHAVDNGIPTLIVADGILEYKNTWLRPSAAAGCIFQPVMGHKIACLGRSQARILESWGNLGKCEVVGAPRLDPLIGRMPRRRTTDQPFRILIATAKTPGFTRDQRTLIKRSVQDLKFWFSYQQKHYHQVIEPVWRLTQDLDQEIGVENNLREYSSIELAKLLENVDAVITTPSTIMLEAILHGLPVALLEYNNCPQYVPAAWTISAPRHIDQVLPELFNPPAAKLLFQETMLHDALECRTPAAPRMAQLVEEMLNIARDCHAGNKSVVFPPRILIDSQAGYHLPEEGFDLQALYPDRPIFREMDRTIVQIEVEQLRTEIKRLRHLIKMDNFFKELSKSFPGPRKLLRLWRESRGTGLAKRHL